jgi:hypothetical protein
LRNFQYKGPSAVGDVDDNNVGEGAGTFDNVEESIQEDICQS